MSEFVKRKARRAYEALIQCVRDALDMDNLEYGVMCGAALVKMADAEKGSYFYEEQYFNEAVDLAKKVLEKAKEASIPSWMEPHLKEIEETLRDWGYEV